MALGLLKIITIACISFLFAAGSKLAAADCSVKNDSGKKVIIVPVDVDVTIDVDVGATVQVPPPQQKCYFKNAESGKQQGPVTLTDGSTYICKDGAVEGTIDIYLGAYVLGVLQLVIKIIVSL